MENQGNGGDKRDEKGESQNLESEKVEVDVYLGIVGDMSYRGIIPPQVISMFHSSDTYNSVVFTSLL